MPELKAEYSTAEMAKTLGISRQAVEKRAAKEGWPSVPRPGQGGRHLYRYETLPWDVRQAILARHFSLDACYIHHPEMPLADREAMHQKFLAAHEKARRAALARFDVIEACHQFIAEKVGFLKAGRRAFAMLYNEGQAPGVEPYHYKTIKSLSVATLELWETKYRQGDLAGLLPLSENQGRKTKVGPEMALLFYAEISALPHTRPCDLVRLMRARRPREEWVHKSNIARWFNRTKKKHQEVFALMRNPGHWRNKFQAAHGSQALPPYAGHTWQIDSTPSDIKTTDKFRCAIVAAVCSVTRRAVVKVAPVSKSEAVAACMRKAVLAWGVPKVILKDNGKDYSSHHIQGICLALGIETPKLPPYAPDEKGIVERFLKTMAYEVMERLPGYLGHSVAERKDAQSRESGLARRLLKAPMDDEAVGVPLSMADLQKVLDAWIRDVYENRPHQGFNREPGRPRAGLTPRQAFEASRVKPELITDERVLDILLTEVGERTVQKDGLHYLGARYFCPPLVGHVKEKVLVRVDPGDAGALYISTKNNTFIGIARNEPLAGQALADYLEARAARSKEVRGRVRALKELSKAMREPYTVDLISGKLAPKGDAPGPESDGQGWGAGPDGRAGGVLPGKAPMAPVIRLSKEFNNPAVQMAREAVAEAARAGAEAGPPPPVIPFRIKAKPAEPADPWAKPPDDVLTGAIRLFEWYLDKQKAVGLKKEDADRAIKMWEDYEEIRYLYKMPSRLSDTEIAVQAVKP